MELQTEALARATDPITSQQAAESIAEHLPYLEQIVLGAIKSAPDGMTIDELAQVLPLDKVTVSPRIAPLRRKGLIHSDGTKRPGISGRAGLVWKTPKETASEDN